MTALALALVTFSVSGTQADRPHGFPDYHHQHYVAIRKVAAPDRADEQLVVGPQVCIR